MNSYARLAGLEGMIEMEEHRMNKPVESQDKMISARESENLAQGLYEELGYAESSEDYLYIKGVVSKTTRSCRAVSRAFARRCGE